MTLPEARKRVVSAFARHVRASRKDILSLVPRTVLWGKLYEAKVLVEVCRQLNSQENASLNLAGPGGIALRAHGGGIKRTYPHIDVRVHGRLIGELWTDIDVVGLSPDIRQRQVTRANYHEVDLLLAEPKAAGRPGARQVLLAVECKNTPYQKALFRELLGLRRELSFLREPQPTAFARWPRSTVPASPPSVLLSYSTSLAINNYADAAEAFGINVSHLPF